MPLRHGCAVCSVCGGVCCARCKPRVLQNSAFISHQNIHSGVRVRVYLAILSPLRIRRSISCPMDLLYIILPEFAFQEVWKPRCGSKEVWFALSCHSNSVACFHHSCRSCCCWCPTLPRPPARCSAPPRSPAIRLWPPQRHG